MSELSTPKMFEAHTISADHKDLIHDVAYDFYGERMATCSSDQYVKVWDSDGEGNWKLSASWKAHHGSVWKVTWAHPEFGQVIATCSFDRTAAIWEEVGDSTLPGSERGLRQWVKRTYLVDSRTSVTDIKFGPKNLGLLLVAGSADGIVRLGNYILSLTQTRKHSTAGVWTFENIDSGDFPLHSPHYPDSLVRIYEAPDVMNLSQWTLQHEIPVKMSISCLSWNPTLSRLNPPMIAIGSDEPNTVAVTKSSSNEKTSSPNEGKVFIYEYSEAVRRWTKTECLSSVIEPVNDLAFAPNLGRSYHLLAVATKDVRIIKIEPLAEASNTAVSSGSGRFKTEVMAAFEDHRSCVWRVAWNVTGTLLASSGDDCCVRLWKLQYLNQWKNVGVLKNDRGQAGRVGSTGGAATGRAHTAYLKMAAMTNPGHMPQH